MKVLQFERFYWREFGGLERHVALLMEGMSHDAMSTTLLLTWMVVTRSSLKTVAEYLRWLGTD
jgi:hypothetical protein